MMGVVIIDTSDNILMLVFAPVVNIVLMTFPRGPDILKLRSMPSKGSNRVLL